MKTNLKMKFRHTKTKRSHKFEVIFFSVKILNVLKQHICMYENFV
jgi:hypothetical protein